MGLLSQMQLTEHFKEEDFYVSTSHPELASAIPRTETNRLKCFFLCTFLLEPLRMLMGGEPILITNGIRSKELNLATGGVPTSEHLFDGFKAAVDFQFPKLPHTALLEAMQHIVDHLHFGQAILELDADGGPLNLHLSLPTQQHSYDALVRLADKKTFEPWDVWLEKEGLEMKTLAMEELKA